MSNSTTAAPTASASSSVKETLTSMVIAFVLAFVFRGFVIEAFLIPTGSMAPTLLGQHMRFKSPQTGVDWPVGPRDYLGPEPLAMQGGVGSKAGPIAVHDPSTLESLDGRANVPLRGGDRIFVLKYLYSVYDPNRFDVVVFKNPTDPTVNYIKRLIGLPGEQVALVDGDVFVRKWASGEQSVDQEASGKPWTLDGWSIARKSERAQLAMWQPLFQSDHAPLAASRNGRTWKGPWRGAGDSADKWTIGSEPAYTFGGTGPATLEWDAGGVFRIDDYYPYNEASESMQTADPLKLPRFPVGDMRVKFGIKPQGEASRIAAVFEARGHEFRTTIQGTAVAFEMRLQEAQAPWVAIGQATLARPFASGEVTNLEFWHADQELQLWVNGSLVGRGGYDWSPAERLEHATGFTPKRLLEQHNHLELLRDMSIYRPVAVRAEFDAGAFTLYRVGLDRDIFYRPDVYNQGNDPTRSHSRLRTAAGGTHPDRTMSLTGDEYFFCGDNSPASLDGRLWDSPSPYVAGIDPNIGVVHRDLVIGRAFFVYFPAPSRKPMPDFGRMRWIW